MHHTYLHYSWDDDGIHLVCRDCPSFDQRLGYEPPVGAVIEASAEHHKTTIEGNPE
jgi:hypothetical protein